MDEKVEIRLNGVCSPPLDPKSIDEIVTKECTVHLEMMSTNVAWIGLYFPDGETWHINISARGKLNVMAEQATPPDKTKAEPVKRASETERAAKKLKEG